MTTANLKKINKTKTVADCNSGGAAAIQTSVWRICRHKICQLCIPLIWALWKMAKKKVIGWKPHERFLEVCHKSSRAQIGPNSFGLANSYIGWKLSLNMTLNLNTPLLAWNSLDAFLHQVQGSRLKLLELHTEIYFFFVLTRAKLYIIKNI